TAARLTGYRSRASRPATAVSRAREREPYGIPRRPRSLGRAYRSPSAPFDPVRSGSPDLLLAEVGARAFGSVVASSIVAYHPPWGRSQDGHDRGTVLDGTRHDGPRGEGPGDASRPGLLPGRRRRACRGEPQHALSGRARRQGAHGPRPRSHRYRPRHYDRATP